MTPQFILWAASDAVRDALVLANAAVCATICFAVVWPRALLMRPPVPFGVSSSYVLIGVAVVASGLSPWLWGEQVGPGQLSMSVAMLWKLMSNSSAWRSDAPRYARGRGRADPDRRHHDRRRVST